MITFRNVKKAHGFDYQPRHVWRNQFTIFDEAHHMNNKPEICGFEQGKLGCGLYERVVKTIEDHWIIQGPLVVYWCSRIIYTCVEDEWHPGSWIAGAGMLQLHHFVTSYYCENRRRFGVEIVHCIYPVGSTNWISCDNKMINGVI